MDKWLKDLYERKYHNQKPHICLPGVKGFISELLVNMFPLMGQVNYDSHESLAEAFANNRGLFLKILKCQTARDAEGFSVTKADEKRLEEVADKFYASLASIEAKLDKDALYFLESDPACLSVDEVIGAYPGFYAIACYRVAHVVLGLGFPVFARMITEIAHHKTGVDIHPGAQISTPFFIDHGTGVVIGETSVIGERVKIYQGVTLGALSVSKNLKNKRRHPCVEDDVVIYSNATILGGETVIGKGTVVGGNVWISSSVPPNSFVHHDPVTTTKMKR